MISHINPRILIKLYNSLSNKIEDIKPLEANTFRIYSCGPTVYDHAHIGNLSSFIYADILKRSLQVAGYKTDHVMNFTDVDDKTISRSQKLYPNHDPLIALKKLTQKFEKVFLSDMTNLNNNITDIKFVRATESIPEMQVLISVLYDSGFAYIGDDGVYFSIELYKKAGYKYGQLLNISESEISKHRINNDEYSKSNISDFALWKLVKNNEPFWKFKLGNQELNGRPGWHIECSAMSSSNLGQPFDIHTGGVDLIFPHHENEIAQSTAGKTEKLYAKVFFHSEHLLVNGHKMSKSLNNFYTIQQIIEKGYDYQTFRLFILQAHFKNQTNFTWENLNSAKNRLNKWLAIADSVWQLSQSKKDISMQLIKLATNNLNTPAILSNIDEYFNKIESEQKAPHKNTISTINQLLGIDLSTPDISSEFKNLILKRQQARSQKDWQLSDTIRSQLEKSGIELNDKNNKTIWSYIRPQSSKKS